MSAYLVRNGVAEYGILIPRNAGEPEKFAASEFAEAVRKMTGAEMTISDRVREKFISIGDTEALREAGLSAEMQRIGEGCFGRRVGENLCIAGRTGKGTLYGVYEYLERAFGYETLGKDLFRFRKKRSLLLGEGDFVSVPTFSRRQSTYGEIRTDPVLCRRMRMETAPEIWAGGNVYHNAFDIAGYGGEDISPWLSREGKQLCYSNPGLRRTFAKNIRAYLADPEKCGDRDLMVLGMEDNTDWCDCPACRAMREKYGSDAAVMLDFVNELSEDLNAERAAQGKAPMTLVMFAYYATFRAPAGMQAGKHVGVMLAPILMRFRKSVSAPENEGFRREAESWAKMTKNLFAWTYNFYTRNSFFTYDTFDEMRELYRFLAGLGVRILFDQTESYQPVSLAWGGLKGYLQAKLMWNADADPEELVDRWFHCAFGASAAAMKKVFRETTAAYDEIYRHHTDDLIWSEIGQQPDRFDCVMPGGVLRESWYRKLLSLLSVLEEEEKKRRAAGEEECADRILTESLQYRYWLCSAYADRFGREELLRRRISFRRDAECLGVTHCREHESVEVLWNRWNLK